MSNPNWPSFPGVPNMATDPDGRPTTQDLIPGKQLGTPLDTALIGRIIQYLCDLRDAIDAEDSAAVSGVLGVADGGVAGAGLHVDPSGDIVFGDAKGNWTTLAKAIDIQQEEKRALAAEGSLLPITAFQKNAVGGLTCTLADGSKVDLVTSSVSDDVNYGVSLLGINHDRGVWLHNAGTGETVWLVRPDDISAALAGYLPLSGGTTTGDIILSGNTKGDSLFGRTLHSKADNSPAGAAFQLVGTRDNPVASLRTVNQAGVAQQWAFNSAAGNVVAPGGGVLPEVQGLGAGRVVEQVFVATGQIPGSDDGEAHVSFPNAFAPGTSPILSVEINREPGGVSRGVCIGNTGTGNNPNVTNTGFSFQPVFEMGDSINTSGEAWTIHVRAIGVME